MSTSAPATQFDRCIEQPTPCVDCGYDQLGLPLSGRCPECGGPTVLALHREQLRFADPAWLRKLRLGVAFIAASFLIPAIAGLALALPVLVGSSVLVAVYMTAAGVATLLAGVGGLWLISSPHPSLIEPPRVFTWRRAIRVAVLVGLAGTAAVLGVHAVLPDGRAVATLTILATPIGAPGVIALWGLTRWTETLARRLQASDTLARGRVYRVATMLLWFGGVLFVMLGTVIGAGARPLAASGVILLLPLTIFAALALLLPVHLLRDLSRVARDAERARASLTDRALRVAEPR